MACATSVVSCQALRCVRPGSGKPAAGQRRPQPCIRLWPCSKRPLRQWRHLEQLIYAEPGRELCWPPWFPRALPWSRSHSSSTSNQRRARSLIQRSRRSPQDCLRSAPQGPCCTVAAAATTPRASPEAGLRAPEGHHWNGCIFTAGPVLMPEPRKTSSRPPLALGRRRFPKHCVNSHLSMTSPTNGGVDAAPLSPAAPNLAIVSSSRCSIRRRWCERSASSSASSRGVVIFLCSNFCSNSVVICV